MDCSLSKTAVTAALVAFLSVGLGGCGNDNGVPDCAQIDPAALESIVGFAVGEAESGMQGMQGSNERTCDYDSPTAIDGDTTINRGINIILGSDEEDYDEWLRINANNGSGEGTPIQGVGEFAVAYTEDAGVVTIGAQTDNGFVLATVKNPEADGSDLLEQAEQVVLLADTAF